MPSLDHFPSELIKSNKLEVSRLFHKQSAELPGIYRSKSVEFIPFVNQRDSMGRLLGKAKPSFRNNDIGQMTSSQYFQESNFDKTNPENKQKINHVIQSFFRKIDMEQRQLRRSTFSPKKIAIVYQKEIRNNFPSNQDYDITNGLSLIKQRNHSVQIKPERNLSKLFSHQQKQDQLANPPNLIKMHSSPAMGKTQYLKKQSKIPFSNKQKIRRNKSNLTVEAQNLNYKSSSKKSSNKLSLKVKMNVQHPQLKRYRELQKLSLKVFPDFQINHQKFFDKMKQSKRIAHNIKKQLQLE